MSANAPTLENPLDSAISQLRSLCSDGELLKSSIDVGSVNRILIHLTNINASVVTSTQDHVNATKRLKDFALTLSRIARNSDPPNEVLASRMASVVSHLRAASEQLAQSDAIPNWSPPAVPQRP